MPAPEEKTAPISDPPAFPAELRPSNVPSPSFSLSSLGPNAGRNTARDDETGMISWAPRRENISDSEKFTIHSPLETKILWSLFVASLALLAAYYWSEMGVLTHSLVGLLGAFIVTGTVDYFQKVYVLRPYEVTRRVLFLWNRYPLPDAFTVERVRGGGVVFVNSITRQVFFSIGRDMTNQSMADALKSLYRYTSNSNFEIG